MLFPFLRQCQKVGYATLLVLRNDKVFFRCHVVLLVLDYGHTKRCSSCDTTDIHKVLRRHKDYITDTMYSIFEITSKMHSQDFEYAFTLEALHNQNRQITELQVEYVAFYQMVASPVRNTTTNLNARMPIGITVDEVREVETTQQQQKDVEMLNVDHKFLANIKNRKATYIHHAFIQ